MRFSWWPQRHKTYFREFQGVYRMLVQIKTFQVRFRGFQEPFKGVTRGFRGISNRLTWFYGRIFHWGLRRIQGRLKAFRARSYQGDLKKKTKSQEHFKINNGDFKSFSMRLWRFQGRFMICQGRFKGFLVVLWRGLWYSSENSWKKSDPHVSPLKPVENYLNFLKRLHQIPKTLLIPP